MAFVQENFDVSDFVVHTKGIKYSRKSNLRGLANLIISGQNLFLHGSVARGDLAVINTGKYVYLGTDSVLHPPYKQFRGVLSYFRQQIGDYVVIEEGSVINAAVVGSYVHIGKSVVIGQRCIIKDCVRIEDGAVLPPDMIVAPFSIVSGSPAKITGRCLECEQELAQQFAIEKYDQFVKLLQESPI
eukprot:CFRG3013T1